MKKYDLLVIGAGAAGIVTAVSAKKKGVMNICVVDRDDGIGGVLNQCRHAGFGMGYFGENMTGTEFAARLEEMFNAANEEGVPIELRLQTTVTEITEDRRAFISSKQGYEEIAFDKCVLATGCRETTIQSLPVAGTRPQGVMTAGEAQKMVNVYGRDVGDDIVILGTGDIGQIMARHFIEQGKNIVAMIEKSDHPGGLERNRRDIIEKYDIPVITDTTVVEVFGKDRVEAVRVRDLVSGEEQLMKCGTLVTAMGLVPEQDIITALKEKQLPHWLTLCGNCEYVHDIVDSVCLESEKRTAYL